ncbi:hypothetical protein [Streptomyces sp. NPDC048489]|uniref:hypothetical protein n=1 Tax=Streptomyces sp. NPDC048489 TaxID=3154504 RepID=UPI00341FE666
MPSSRSNTSRFLTPALASPVTSSPSRDERAIAYTNAAQQFDQNLANYINSQMPDVAQEVAKLTYHAWNLVATRNPAGLSKFGRDDPRVPGSVGTDLRTLEDRVRSGNIREHVSMLAASTRGANNAYAGIMMFPRFEEMEAQRKVRQRVPLPPGASLDHRSMQPPLSDAEWSFGVKRNQQGQDELQWASGEDYVRLPFSYALHQQSSRIGGLVTTGVSGSTALLLDLARGVSEHAGVDIDMKKIRLAAIGAYCSVRHHTLHEVMMGADAWDERHDGIYDLGYSNDIRRYRNISPLTESQLREIAPNRTFPDEYLVGTPRHHHQSPVHQHQRTAPLHGNLQAPFPAANQLSTAAGQFPVQAPLVPSYPTGNMQMPVTQRHHAQGQHGSGAADPSSYQGR